VAEEPKVKEEIKQMRQEPLLPVEKHLIAWSLGIGAVLMVVLIWVSRKWF
jgi:hypothetical protein